MLTDGAGASVTPRYENQFEYGADDIRPEGVNAGAPRKDLSIHISVDSPLDLEDRSLSSLVMLQSGFSLRESKICQFGWPAGGWSDGYPSGHKQGALHGMYRPNKLYIPVHADSRVRVSVVIPYYNETIVADNRGWSEGGTEVPWWNQTFVQTLSYLEPIENGKD